MRKILVAILFVLIPLTSHAQCVQTIDKQAFDLRALKSSLMVAALSCGQGAQYNSFLKKYDKILASGGSLIQAYFKRTYKTGTEHQINKFFTTLANNASNVSMNADPDQYCDQTAAVFQQLAALNSNGIIEFSDQYSYSSMHGLPSCPTAQQYTANTTKIASKN